LNYRRFNRINGDVPDDLIRVVGKQRKDQQQIMDCKHSLGEKLILALGSVAIG